MAKEKFDIVFTVCKKKLPQEISIFAKDNIHITLSDGKKLPDNLYEAVSLVEDSILNDNKTLLHCYLGRNRSWLVAAIVYARLKMVTGYVALETMREIYPASLKNKFFEEYLKSDSLHNR